MLYDEFIKGTGCKQNEHNFKVYKRLELIYSNDDSVTKEDIYEYGKKLVDNSDSPEMIAIKQELQAEIQNLYNDLDWQQNGLIRNKELLQYTDKKTEALSYDYYKSNVNHYKRLVTETKSRIRQLKYVLQ